MLRHSRPPLGLAALLLSTSALAAPALATPALAAPERRMPETQMELGLSYEPMTNGYADWQSRYFFGALDFGRRDTLYAQIRETDRFAVRDQEVMVGRYYPLGERVTGMAEASFSPSAVVLPRYSAQGLLLVDVGNGWSLGGALARTEYSSALVHRGTLTVERYWQAFRFALASSLSQVADGSLPLGHTAQVSFYPDDRNSVTLTAGTGEEVEALGPGQVLRTNVRSLSLSGRYWLDSRWGLTPLIAWTEQGSYYHRMEMRLGLRYRL